MSDRQADIAALRRHLLDAETAIVSLNRQITEAIVVKQAVGGLSTELETIITARNAMRDRLSRLDDAAAAAAH